LSNNVHPTASPSSVGPARVNCKNKSLALTSWCKTVLDPVDEKVEEDTVSDLSIGGEDDNDCKFARMESRKSMLAVFLCLHLLEDKCGLCCWWWFDLMGD